MSYGMGDPDDGDYNRAMHYARCKRCGSKVEVLCGKKKELCYNCWCKTPGGKISKAYYERKNEYKALRRKFDRKKKQKARYDKLSKEFENK